MPAWLLKMLSPLWALCKWNPPVSGGSPHKGLGRFGLTVLSASWRSCDVIILSLTGSGVVWEVPVQWRFRWPRQWPPHWSPVTAEEETGTRWWSCLPPRRVGDRDTRDTTVILSPSSRQLQPVCTTSDLIKRTVLKVSTMGFAPVSYPEIQYIETAICTFLCAVWAMGQVYCRIFETGVLVPVSLEARRSYVKIFILLCVWHTPVKVQKLLKNSNKKSL